MFNDIIHANLHACKREIGICIPFVGKEPGLVTHTPAMCGNNEDGSPKECATEYTVDLDPGKWNLIMHDRVKLYASVLKDMDGEDWGPQ